MGKVTVRPATADDLEAVRSVGLASWPATYAFAGDDYVRHGLETWWSPEAVRRSFEQTTTLVAEVAGAVVGTGNLDLRRSPPVIWKLYVLPTNRGQGVGSTLLAGLLDHLPPTEAAVTLEYLDGNEAAATFYAGHGFRVVRREPAEILGWPDTVWMERQAGWVRS